MKKVLKKVAKWDQKSIDWAKSKGLSEYQVGLVRLATAVVVAVVFL